MNRDVFLSLLALDSYNRGPEAAISGLSDAPGTKLGNVTIDRNSSVLKDANGNSLDVAAGFYAIAYEQGAQTYISYRGTSTVDPLATLTDARFGWVTGAGFADQSQGDLAMKFYQSVTGVSVYDAPDVIGHPHIKPGNYGDTYDIP